MNQSDIEPPGSPILEPSFPYAILPFDPAFFAAIDTIEDNDAES